MLKLQTMANAINKKHLKQIACLLFAFFIAVALTAPVSAATDIVTPDDLTSLPDDGQYINYVHNYALDIEKLGITDAGSFAINAIAGFLFALIKFFGWVSTIVFYHCFSLDVASLFGDKLDSMVSSMSNSVFDALFLLAFSFCAIYLVKQLFKKNSQAAISQVLLVILLCTASAFITTNTSKTLQTINTITKQTSATVMNGIVNPNSDVTASNYAAVAASTIWSTSVHKVWISAEFGTGFNYEDSGNKALIHSLLTQRPSSEERKNIVQGYADSDTYFTKDAASDRLGLTFFLLLPALAKCVLYLFFALLMVAFQVVTLIFFISSPIVLLLAIIPSLGGIALVQKWIQEIAYAQLSVIMMSVIIGVILMFDSWITSSNSFGWIIGSVIEILVFIGIYYFRNKLLNFFEGIKDVFNNPKELHSMVSQAAENINADPAHLFNEYKRNQQEKEYNARVDNSSELFDGMMNSYYVASAANNKQKAPEAQDSIMQQASSAPSQMPSINDSYYSTSSYERRPSAQDIDEIQNTDIYDLPLVSLEETPPPTQKASSNNTQQSTRTAAPAADKINSTEYTGQSSISSKSYSRNTAQNEPATLYSLSDDKAAGYNAEPDWAAQELIAERKSLQSKQYAFSGAADEAMPSIYELTENDDERNIE